MTNQQISHHLNQLADLLEFQGANPFRLRAYRNAARVIEELTESIRSLVERNYDLTQIEGIGKAVAEKCVQMITTGRLRQLDELLQQVPKSVLQLLRIPRLGPKKASALFHQLNISTLDQLEAACQAGEVRKLKGFGEKTEKDILKGIETASSAKQRMLWAEADALVRELREYLRPCREIRKIEFAGSYRRGKETVGDLDILVVSDNFDAVMDHLAKYQDVCQVIARGSTKMSIRIADEIQVDLRVVPAESFGAALQYFTGSKDHNVILRGMARQRGLKINEWGVFRVSGDRETYVAGRTENEVYRELNLPVFPPEIREAREEFRWADNGRLPKLIQLADIQGDLHMHTDATDGRESLAAMVAAARKAGLKYIAITDHSKRVSMAGGLDADRLRRQWKQIDQLNARSEDDFLILKGVELDILENGEMDLPDDVLAEADWVTASIHYGQNQSRTQITDRILGAIENPHVWSISHPTGRLINRRKAYEVDLEAIFDAAARRGKMLELNANPARLDLDDVQCAAARQHSIPIVINTDAHSCEGLNDMRFGVIQARRAGLTRSDVANARSWSKLKSLRGQNRSS